MLGDPEPVLELEGAALGAHHFAKINDIHRRVREALVKRQHRFTCPEIEDRTDG